MTEAAEAPKSWLTPKRAILLSAGLLFWLAMEFSWFGLPVWTTLRLRWLVAWLDLPFPARRGMALLMMMAVWWVTETLPLHWTSLLPLLFIPLFPALMGPPALIDKSIPLSEQLIPLTRWQNFTTVGWAYLNPFIMIFMGGMLIGVAMEEHNLHRRIALNIMKAIGSSPRRILLGFAVSTAFISMWISNTATAVMMVPIGLAVISQLEVREARKLPLLGQSIMLSIAYAANIGGIGTLIGTPPNMQLRGYVADTYAGSNVDFLRYMTVGFPVVVLLLPVMYGLLVWICRKERIRTVESDILLQEIDKLGPMARAEKIVMGVFLFTSAMWMLSDPVRSVLVKVDLLKGLKGDQLDAFWALVAPVALMSLRVLSPKGIKRMPWDVLILLGGSYALGRVVQGSRLSDEMVVLLKHAGGFHPLLIMGAVTVTTIILTAFSANAASAQLMMILITGSLDPSKSNPKGTIPYLYGAAISSSCDFMLPCGTPPNAIVFGTRYVSIRAMAATGFVLDLLSAFLVALWIWGAARHWIA
jgi:solute carrier family 13 (sodium-dependent dicarboxylate transporter), member 2/3/5